jgi:hypothetical protein
VAFPTTSVLDTFTQADGALSGSWTNDPFGTTQPAPTVATNAMAFGTFGCAAWWNVSTFGADSETFCTISTKPANGDFLQVFGRIQTPGSTAGDAYKVELGAAAGTDTLDFYRVINGVDTAVGTTTSLEFNVGDKIGLEVLGTGATVTLNCYRHNGTSWSLAATMSDTDALRIVSAGNIGVGLFQTTATGRIDDFGGGTVAAATAAPSPRAFNAIPFIGGGL